MASKTNIEIDQNSDYFLSIAWTDAGSSKLKDLTGYKANMQIKPDFSSEAVISLKNGSDITILSSGSYNIVVKIPAIKTLNIETPFIGVYDLLMTDPDNVKTRLLEGDVKITPAVTKNV